MSETVCLSEITQVGTVFDITVRDSSQVHKIDCCRDFIFFWVKSTYSFQARIGNRECSSVELFFPCVIRFDIYFRAGEQIKQSGFSCFWIAKKSDVHGLSII